MKLKQTLLLFTILLSGSLMAQTVKHFAGKPYDATEETFNNPTTCDIADAWFYKPEGITWDKNGHMWITENNKIRLLQSGGTQFYNRAGLLGDGNTTGTYKNATGIVAGFRGPSSITSDASGTLFVVDAGNHAIRKIEAFSNTSLQQIVTTYAGALPDKDQNGIDGSADLSGTSARFNFPQSIAQDASGNFYVTDLYNSTIRKITAGAVSTVAGTAGVQGSKDGKTGIALLESPYGIAIWGKDTLIVSDQSAGTIRQIILGSINTVSTLCGVYGENSIKIDGTLSKARFTAPRGIVIVNRRIFVCDGSCIRVIDPAAGTVSTYAGSETQGNKDGVGTAAQFGLVVGIAYNQKQNLLYVTDHLYNTIKTVTIVTPAPAATFTIDKTSAVLNTDIVTLTNTTPKTPTVLKWTITPMDYTITSGTLTSTTAPLKVKFTKVGNYTVKLDVTTADGPLSITKTDAIKVATTGISNISKNLSITVSPNPSNGIFTVQNLEGNYPIQSFEVTDITGKVLFTKNCGNSLSETFDISHVQNGFYFLKVNTSEGSNTLKLQKN